MIDYSVREQLMEEGCERSAIFKHLSYDESIIGYTLEGSIVYDFESMVEEYMKKYSCDRDEAVEFISYNTIRTIPYMNHDRMVPPTIMYRIHKNSKEDK